MSKSQKYQCCIAGGGPAGMMLGYLLARSGIKTVVLEKWGNFLRDFRGDTIHPSTMQVLNELGLLKDFLKLPYNKTKKVSARIGGREISIADFKYLNIITPFVAFMPQWHFLNFIAEKGKALSHFHLMMETEVKNILVENETVIGVHAIHKGEPLEIQADMVVGTDGRHSTVREKADLTVLDKSTPIDVLWFRISRQQRDDDQSFGVANYGRLLIMLDRGDYWQCAFIIPKGGLDDLKKKGLASFHSELLRLTALDKAIIEEIKSWDDIKLLSVKVDRLKKWHRPGLLCIGDAAHAMSPIGGVGINLAIQDAVAAANVLVPAFRKGIPGVGDFKKIQKRRTMPTRVTQKFQVFIQDKILAPYMQTEKAVKPPLAFKLFEWFPFLRWLPARFIGIGARPEHVKLYFEEG